MESGGNIGMDMKVDMKKVVLFFHQSDFLMKQLEEVVRNTGSVVIHVTSIQDVIIYANKLVPHLIVIDVDAFKDLKSEMLILLSNNINYENYFVVLSQTPMKVTRNTARKLGELECVVKDTNPNVILRRIRTILREMPLISVAMIEENQESLEVALSCKVTASEKHEHELVLKAPVKITPNSTVKVQSEYFQDINLDHCLFQKSMKAPVCDKDFNYLNEMILIGIGSSAALNLQKLAVR